jgi:hypothetical protein
MEDIIAQIANARRDFYWNEAESGPNGKGPTLVDLPLKTGYNLIFV